MNFSLKLLHSPRTRRKRAPGFQVKTRRGGTARAPAAVLPERVSFTLTLERTSLPRAPWCGDRPSAACLGHCRGRRRLREKSADPLPDPWSRRGSPQTRTFQVRARPRLTACGLWARLGAGPPDAGNALPRDVLRNLSPLFPQARLRGGGGGPRRASVSPPATACGRQRPRGRTAPPEETHDPRLGAGARRPPAAHRSDPAGSCPCPGAAAGSSWTQNSWPST